MRQANENFSDALDKLFALLGLSFAEKDRIGADLGEAVYLNFIHKIFDRLPPEAIENFDESALADPYKLINFIGLYIKERPEELLKESVVEVTAKFTQKLK